jgi:hypothetical protein
MSQNFWLIYHHQNRLDIKTWLVNEKLHGNWHFKLFAIFKKIDSWNVDNNKDFFCLS